VPKRSLGRRAAKAALEADNERRGGFGHEEPRSPSGSGSPPPSVPPSEGRPCKKNAQKAGDLAARRLLLSPSPDPADPPALELPAAAQPSSPFAFRRSPPPAPRAQRAQRRSQRSPRSQAPSPPLLRPPTRRGARTIAVSDEEADALSDLAHEMCVQQGADLYFDAVLQQPAEPWSEHFMA